MPAFESKFVSRLTLEAAERPQWPIKTALIG